MGDFLRDVDDPPAQIWRGGMAGTISGTSKLDGVLPSGWMDGRFQRLGGLDQLGKMVREKGDGE